MTTLPIGRLRLPLAGGAYLRFLPPALFRGGFDRLRRAGEPIVLYVHPWEVDADQPRQEVGWKIRTNHYFNLRHTEGRLTRLLSGHRFRPLREVLGDYESSNGLEARSLAA